MATKITTHSTAGINPHNWTLNEAMSHSGRMFKWGMWLGLSGVVVSEMFNTGQLPSLIVLVFGLVSGVLVGSLAALLHGMYVTHLNYQLFYEETIEERPIDTPETIPHARIPVGNDAILVIPQPHHSAFSRWATAVTNSRAEFSKEQARKRGFDWDKVITELQRGRVVHSRMDGRGVHNLTDMGGKYLADWLRLDPPTPQ